MLSEDGSGKGAALVAAVASQQQSWNILTYYGDIFTVMDCIMPFIAQSNNVTLKK